MILYRAKVVKSDVLAATIGVVRTRYTGRRPRKSGRVDGKGCIADGRRNDERREKKILVEVLQIDS